MPEKPKLAMYWASSCGGCEISVVNLHEGLLEAVSHFDFVFCPCLIDTKKKDIESLPDRSIAVTLFNGAVRTGENEEMARLLRKKSELLVAFGSCASEGCIPGLSNWHSQADHMRTVFLEGPTIDNPSGIVPAVETAVPEGTLHLPAFHDEVKTLPQVAEVDYIIPGCPPESGRIGEVLAAIAQGQLPPRGSVVGAGRSAVCDECDRKKEDKRVQRFQRIYELIPDREACLLDQGIICMGIATRDGCGALCPRVNMPCTGCYGPPEGVRDQGAKMIAALGSILDIGDTRGLSEEEIAARTDAVLDAVPDLAGIFYKYSLPGSILGRRIS